MNSGFTHTPKSFPISRWLSSKSGRRGIRLCRPVRCCATQRDGRSLFFGGASPTSWHTGPLCPKSSFPRGGSLSAPKYQIRDTRLHNGAASGAEGLNIGAKINSNDVVPLMCQARRCHCSYIAQTKMLIERLIRGLSPFPEFQIQR